MKIKIFGILDKQIVSIDEDMETFTDQYAGTDVKCLSRLVRDRVYKSTSLKNGQYESLVDFTFA